jgi:hypothetical protein
VGLGRNECRILSFVGTRLSASRAPPGPHTAPLAPCYNIITILLSLNQAIAAETCWLLFNYTYNLVVDIVVFYTIVRLL